MPGALVILFMPQQKKTTRLELSTTWRQEGGPTDSSGSQESDASELWGFSRSLRGRWAHGGECVLSAWEGKVEREGEKEGERQKGSRIKNIALKTTAGRGRSCSSFYGITWIFCTIRRSRSDWSFSFILFFLLPHPPTTSALLRTSNSSREAAVTTSEKTNRSITSRRTEAS